MKATLTSCTSQSQKPSRAGGQAIIEFAIVLPILIMLLVGIMEVGRMVLIYAAVNNASRESVRYASAIGLNHSGGIERYRDCAGIKNIAKRSAFLVTLQDADINISYDHGPGQNPFDTCDGTADTAVSITTGGPNPDRVTVTISGSYSPMVRLLPIGARLFTSRSSRTIFGIVALAPPPTATVGGGGPAATATSPSSTVAPTSTPTATATRTATPGQVYTFTPMITPSITLLPSSTATTTKTPTATATSICANVIATSIDINNKKMSTTITNPNGFAITVVSVQARWNSASGGQGGSQLALIQAQLTGTSFWNGTDTSGNLTITPPSLTIAAGGTPTLTFTFASNYKNTNGTSITLNLSAPACGTFSITKIP